MSMEEKDEEIPRGGICGRGDLTLQVSEGLVYGMEGKLTLYGS